MSRRVLLVTGGGRGIGAAVARKAALAGWDVAVNYARDVGSAEAVCGEVRAAGGKAAALKGDTADASDVAALFEGAAALLGPIRGVVNNAGMVGSPAGRLAEAAPEMIARVIAVNVTGALLVAREAARSMSTSRGGQGGAIVNLSSIAARLGSPGEYVWYAASKGAVDTMTVGLARELARDGVRVNAVSPGLIDTEIHASGGQPDRLARLGPGVPLGRAGTAEEVADAVMWLMSEQASYVTGATIEVGGGR